MLTPIRSHHLARLALTAILCVGLLAGCKKVGNTHGGGEVKKGGHKVNPPLGQPKAKAPTPKMPPKMPPKMAKRPLYSGAHILIAYKGAMKATTTRSKDEALKLAKQLTAEARKAPDTFSKMAKKHSEGPSGKMGGFLQIWPKGSMLPAFDQAIEKLKFDEISDPVETGYGFHVIRRLQIFAGGHILIAYKGAMRADPKITRSKEEAKKLATELAAKAKKAAKAFPKLAAENSDCPSKNKGGNLGVWWKGRMAKAFDGALEKLKVGEVSGVVETPFGFHVIMRAKAPETT